MRRNVACFLWVLEVDFSFEIRNSSNTQYFFLQMQTHSPNLTKRRSSEGSIGWVLLPFHVLSIQPYGPITVRSGSNSTEAGSDAHGLDPFRRWGLNIIRKCGLHIFRHPLSRQPQCHTIAMHRKCRIKAGRTTLPCVETRMRGETGEVGRVEERIKREGKGLSFKTGQVYLDSWRITCNLQRWILNLRNHLSQK